MENGNWFKKVEIGNSTHPFSIFLFPELFSFLQLTNFQFQACMKIVIDVRCLMEGRRTGVEEYTLGLLENIFLLDKKNDYVLFLNSAKEPRFDFSRFSKNPNVKIKRFKIPNKLLNFCFWYLGWPHIDKMCGGAEVVFFPNIAFGAVSRDTKLITTIHDLSFERYGEYFSLKRKWWHIFINVKRICRRSNRIIAVSDSTGKDITNLYGINPQKVAVIPSAVSDRFRVVDRNDEKLIRVKEKYKLPYKFILFLGTIEPRKNIIGVVRAYEALQKQARKNNIGEILRYKLVIAGESGWKNEEIFAEINNSACKKDIRVVNFVEDDDKPYLYNLSSLFVYASFFEGFGFPPLEAQACGVPVITSNNSSLPEIVGDAAVMIDPDKPDEIYRAMREILTDSGLYETLRAKGLRQSATFNWKKTAEETLKIIIG